MNSQQEHATLAKAYEPIESLLVLADNDTPFAQKEVLFDLVQTMAHTYDASNSASLLGDTEKATDFKGLTESLGQFYSVLLGAYEDVKPYLPSEARAAIGIAKGAAKNVVGVAHAICKPKETMRALEVALNKLDYHAGRLYRGNPEEWAQVHAAIKAFSNMSDGDRAEFLGELAGSIWGGPALLTKGVSAGAKLLQETRLLEKTNVLIQKYGVKALEITKTVAADDKFAVTPEGIKVPIQMAAEGEDAVGVIGNKVKSSATDSVGEAPQKPGTLRDAGAQAPSQQKIPANQIIKREDRPIRIKRVDYEAIEKYLDAKVAGTDKALFKKGNFKHICGIDKKVKYIASGEIKGFYSGYHYDKGFSLEKKGRVEFPTGKKVCPKTGAVRVDTMKIEGIEKDGPFTFFPPEWTNTQLVDKIWEASQNIVETIKDGETCLEVIGKTNEGLEIFMVIRKADQYLVTAYPDLKIFDGI